VNFGKLFIIAGMALITLVGGIVWLVVWSKKRRDFVMELHHGCRAAYGPLELRIQTTRSSSGFLVGVDDPRQPHPCVSEHAIQGDLDAAKEDAGLAAGEYLSGREEAIPHAATWRCS